MTSRTKMIIKMTSAGGLLVAAVALGISQVYYLTATGEEGLRVWFYDQSEQRLYAVARDTIPPHEGVGGAKGDGVRAVVVACQTECGDTGKRRIAYLETYTPELKMLLEDLRAARAEGRAPVKPIPSGESDYFDKNTLVRRPVESSWHDMTTAEAKRIVAEWREWHGPDGSSLVVCTP